MNFHIITLFPNAFDSYLGESILKRAIEDKKIAVFFYNPREYADLPRGKAGGKKGRAVRVDKKPYGGGPGMVIQAMPVVKALEAAHRNIHKISKNKKVNKIRKPKIKIIFLNPGGKLFTTDYAKNISKKYTDIIIISGRYEGIDARVKKIFKAEDVSIGNFVLTGGELPAMILIDCMSRQIPGVLGDFNSLEESRVSSRDVYTRPEVFTYKNKKYRVPKILLSGHHANIDTWKKKKQ